jgi:hypothetical protein
MLPAPSFVNYIYLQETTTQKSQSPIRREKNSAADAGRDSASIEKA